MKQQVYERMLKQIMYAWRYPNTADVDEVIWDVEDELILMHLDPKRRTYHADAQEDLFSSSGDLIAHAWDSILVRKPVSTSYTEDMWEVVDVFGEFIMLVADEKIERNPIAIGQVEGDRE